MSLAILTAMAFPTVMMNALLTLTRRSKENVAARYLKLTRTVTVCRIAMTVALTLREFY
jgi:hypothetical protein